jgi:hypothetical protein
MINYLKKQAMGKSNSQGEALNLQEKRKDGYSMLQS